MGGGTLSITQTYKLDNVRDHEIAVKIIQDYVVNHTPEIFDVDVIDKLRERD